MEMIEKVRLKKRDDGMWEFQIMNEDEEWVKVFEVESESTHPNCVNWDTSKDVSLQHVMIMIFGLGPI